jgi:hypothetical protein
MANCLAYLHWSLWDNTASALFMLFGSSSRSYALKTSIFGDHRRPKKRQMDVQNTPLCSSRY